MKIKEQTIKELDTLEPSELSIVYDLILSLKGKAKEKKAVKPLKAYQRVRELLKSCKGSLSNDVLLTREDRI